ncbi:MAG: slipin family protein [Bdellovibrionaceae bacterium]|nr:slipin family protein [Pseudobdellovibrionaceae bacterium]
MGSFIGFLAVFAVFILFSSFKILNEWEKGVVLRLGRSIGIRGPGLVFVIPFIEKIYKVDLRTVTMDVPSQDVITQDNISLKVNAVVYFRVTNAEEAISKVADFYFGTSQLAQTTLRSVLGQFQMDEILEQRDKINHRLQELIDKQTEPWGVKVSLVEVKNIDLPKEMQAAMARQAEAERERRAKIISAEGELQRAEKLSDASKKLAESPSALQLAYLQTLTEIANNDGTRTIVFPIPIDFLKGLMGKDA